MHEPKFELQVTESWVGPENEGRFEVSFSSLPKGGQNEVVWISLGGGGTSMYPCAKHVAN